MSRCIECGSKGDCRDWCGISPEEIYNDYENLTLENEKLRECVELFLDNVNYYESELAGSWLDIRKQAEKYLKELEK